jgi:hypothetical protein
MPNPAFAAIVVGAVPYFSKPGYLRKLFARSLWEIPVAAILIAGGL